MPSTLSCIHHRPDCMMAHCAIVVSLFATFLPGRRRIRQLVLSVYRREIYLYSREPSFEPRRMPSCHHLSACDGNVFRVDGTFSSQSEPRSTIDNLRVHLASSSWFSVARDGRGCA